MCCLFIRSCKSNKLSYHGTHCFTSYFFSSFTMRCYILVFYTISHLWLANNISNVLCIIWLTVAIIVFSPVMFCSWVCYIFDVSSKSVKKKCEIFKDTSKCLMIQFSLLTECRNTWPLVQILFRFVDRHYVKHVFLAFKQNASWACSSGNFDGYNYGWF